jgi:hypothetical protein
MHAWASHPRLGNKVKRKEATNEMDFGSACHKLMLGRGAAIAVCEENSWQKNVAKDFKHEAREAGQIPLLAKDYVRALEVKVEFERQMRGYGLWEEFEAASSEVVMIYNDGPIRCRAMLDKLLLNGAAGKAIIFDVKTTGSADPRGLDRLVFNQNYDMQDYSYTNGLGILHPDLLGRIDFMFLFQETEYPYCLQPARLNGELRMLGASKWTRAWQMWDACLKADNWPSYAREIIKIEPPKYGLASEMSAQSIIPKSE